MGRHGWGSSDGGFIPRSILQSARPGENWETQLLCERDSANKYIYIPYS